MDASQWLSISTAAAGTILLARLLWLRQTRRYHGLTFWLAQHLLWGYALSIIPRKNNQAYVWVYEASNPIEWIAATWCVVYLLDLALGKYPGIRTLSRWAIWGSTAVSLSATLALARLFWSGGIRGKRQLFYIEVADRSVLLSLALVILLTLAFLSRYPLGLPRNARISVVGFSAVVLSAAGARLLDSRALHLSVRWIDMTQIALEGVIYLIWAWLLRPEDDQTLPPDPPPPDPNPEGEAKLLEQLKAMDKFVNKLGRR